MRAAVFAGPGRLSIEDRPEPMVAAGEILVAVEACGICGTDVQILNTPPGHPATPGTILGHEFVGRVVATGDTVAGDIVIGQRVVVDPDPKCGACGPCRAGRPANCQNIVALGIFRDGGLAAYVSAPFAAVYPIADHVPAELATLVEPLACVINGTGRAGVRPGESVIVFGAGAIGCLFTAVVKAAGAGRIIVVEPSATRRAVARQVGADEVVTPDEFAADRVSLSPDGADVVIDAVGSLLPAAIEAAAMGGRVVLFGMNANARPAVPQVAITEKGLSILGSYISNFTFPAAIRLAERGQLRLGPIISDVLSLDRVVDGIDLLRSGQATKVVITP